MISRCALCHSLIFGNRCLCGKTAVRCPDCNGDGRKKSLELLEDSYGYLGYVTKTLPEKCSLCNGRGMVTVRYRQIKEDVDG